MQTVDHVTSLRGRLWDAEFRPIPIFNHDAKVPDPGKQPLGAQWQLAAREDPPFCATSPAVPHALNTGILCDGLRPIDFDIDDPTLARQCVGIAAAMFGEAPVRTRNGSSRCLMLYRAAEGEPSKRTLTGRDHTKDFACKIEVLGKGQQFVAFGIHPSGAVLEWFPEPPGQELRASLPAVTEDQVQAFLLACAPLLKAESPVKPNGQDHGPSELRVDDPLRLAAAMADIPNAGPADWEEWNKVGMAIWAATDGTPIGLELLNAWSARNPAYVLKEVERRWANYRKSPPNRIGAGTIFHLAREAREAKPADFADERPIVRVLSGLRHKAADEGLAALMTTGVEFYQRDKTLVRTALSKAKSADGREIEVPSLVAVTNAVLARALGTVAEWERLKADGTPVRIDPPKEVVEQIGAMFGEWPFPPLAGVIATPTLRPDGSLLSKPGYDRSTGLVLQAPPPMPHIPERPSQHDALEALAKLNGLLSEFPFTDEESRSVAISMMMTPVLRGALVPAVPMHVVTAPAAGTGKSYLLDTAAAIATGERCPVFAVAPKPEETEKRLVGAAISGFPIIALDNVSDLLTGDFLAQVTERPILQVRPLGGSQLARIANTFTLFANGNNVVATADLVRRTLRCSLDADMENPEEREFAADPVASVLADRGGYVAAVLTIARAYLAAGSPNKCRRLPSYGAWSDIVRSAIVWLGWPDPVISMDLQRAEDPVRRQRADMFNAWDTELKDRDARGLQTLEVIEAANDWVQGVFLRPALRDACLAIAKERHASSISAERLGKWLRSAANTRVGNLKLLVNRDDQKRPRWQLVVLE